MNRFIDAFILVAFLALSELILRQVPFKNFKFSNTWNHSIIAERMEEFNQNPFANVFFVGNSRIIAAFDPKRFDPLLHSAQNPVRSLNLGVSSSGPLLWRALLNRLPTSQPATVFIFPWIDDFNDSRTGAGLPYLWNMSDSLRTLTTPFTIAPRPSSNNKIKESVRGFKYKMVAWFRNLQVTFTNQFYILNTSSSISSEINGYLKQFLENKLSPLHFVHRSSDQRLEEEIPWGGSIHHTIVALENLKKNADSQQIAYPKNLDPPYEIADLNHFAAGIREFVQLNPKNRLIIVWLPFQPPYLNFYSESGRNWFKKVLQEVASTDQQIKILDLQIHQSHSQFDLNDFYDPGEHFTYKSGIKLEKILAKTLKDSLEQIDQLQDGGGIINKIAR